MNKHYCTYCMTPVADGESCSVCRLTSGAYVPSPHHLPPGTVLLDRYLVGRVLGEGGFGITYIGCDLRLELKVAIKEYYPCDRATRNASASLEVTSFIGPSAKSFQRGKQKFLGEAQVMARMDKQQVIVSVRDFFEINNTAYIVMEYIEGITFHELVEKKGGKIDPKELFPMIEPLFGALSIMHENGLIHRDISPDNLMLENGRIRLLDFGCAREASRGTETMTIALKHGYAPIEQYQQKGQGPWTDIYALCATIYYCLTGKVPPQALDRISGDELLLPGKLGVHLTEGQEQALLKGMRLQPNRRFSTAKELWAGLYAQSAEPGQELGGRVPLAADDAVPTEEKHTLHDAGRQEDLETAYGAVRDVPDARSREGADTAHEAVRDVPDARSWEGADIAPEVVRDVPDARLRESADAAPDAVRDVPDARSWEGADIAPAGSQESPYAVRSVETQAQLRAGRDIQVRSDVDWETRPKDGRGDQGKPASGLHPQSDSGMESELASKDGQDVAVSGEGDIQGAHEEVERPDEVTKEQNPGTDEGKGPSDEVTREQNKLPYRKNIYLLPGIAAACIAIFIGFMVYRNATKDVWKPADGDVQSSHTGSESGSLPNSGDEGTEPDDGAAEGGKTNGGRQNLFANAYTFTDGGSGEFQRLLEETSVTAIIIDCVNFTTYEALSITKPVLVAEGAYLAASNLTVTQEGYLQVEGVLDMSNEPGFLRLEGSGMRLYIAEAGAFYGDRSFLWMDNADCLVRADGGNTDAHTLVFSQDAFDRNGVVSVTDFESLSRAADLGQVISIDGDITLTDEVSFSAPVRISEGMTVHTTLREQGRFDEDWGCFGFALGKGGVLVNNGVLDGRSVWTGGDGVIINNGFMTGDTSMEGAWHQWNSCASLWISEESTFVNYGTVEAAGCSRFWDNSLLFNMDTGVLKVYDFYLIGGNMANFGQVVLPEGSREYCPSFFIQNGSLLANYPGGAVSVAAGSNFENNSRIYNTGEFVIRNGGSFRNALLENDGFFQAEYGAYLGQNENRAGIYCGSGEYDLGRADVAPYFTYGYGYPSGWNGLVDVASEQELRDALAAPGTPEILVTGDITVEADLVVRRDLYIADGCRLVMADGAALTGYACILGVMPGASLQGGNISLYEGAQIYLGGDDSLLAVEGALTLDASLLWGQRGNIRMNGAGLVLKNRAGFWFHRLSSFEAVGGEITLQNGAVFLGSLDGGIRMERAAVTLSENGGGACFHVIEDAVFQDCDLNIDGGLFKNSAENLTLQNCRMTIGEKGRLENYEADLSLLGGSAMEIWGSADISGWDEQTFTVHGTVTNHGTLYLNMFTDLSEPIDNRGELYYSSRQNARFRYYHGKDRVDISYIGGNPPIDWD